jgi:hypothetical protein
MTLRRIQVWAVAVVLSTLLLASGMAQPTSRNSATPNMATTVFTFEGCWTQFPSGPCRDVFRDDQGNYWICKACGTTGNPTPGKCSIISPTTLAHGFWCS